MRLKCAFFQLFMLVSCTLILYQRGKNNSENEMTILTIVHRVSHLHCHSDLSSCAFRSSVIPACVHLDAKKIVLTVRANVLYSVTGHLTRCGDTERHILPTSASP